MKVKFIKALKVVTPPTLPPGWWSGPNRFHGRKHLKGFSSQSQHCAVKEDAHNQSMITNCTKPTHAPANSFVQLCNNNSVLVTSRSQTSNWCTPTSTSTWQTPTPTSTWQTLTSTWQTPTSTSNLQTPTSTWKTRHLYPK